MKITLNPDAELCERVRQMLEKNEYYCPTKKIHTPDNACVCKEFVESNKLGKCPCGLYIKVEL